MTKKTLRYYRVGIYDNLMTSHLVYILKNDEVSPVVILFCK